MAHKALYRQWRPNTFEDMVGQHHITRILKNQIKSDQTGHAYLFCGTRGTGKTSTAKIFAKGVNCISESSGRPCGVCENCQSIQNGTFMDVIEIDAASNNGVDNVRELRESVKYPPAKGRYKVYIIDEVHMLSTGAFNALLKTLEEPPSYVIFILATTEPHKLPATILSRCLRLDFRRVPEKELIQRMHEICENMGIDIEDNALMLIAGNADGSVRDALSILDQCVSIDAETITRKDVVEVLGTAGEELFIEMTELVFSKNTSEALLLIEKLSADGKDIRQFIRDWIYHLRNLMMTHYSDQLENVISMSCENIERIKKQGRTIDLAFINNAIMELSNTSLSAKWSTQPRILLELAVVKLSNPQMSQSMDAVLDRLSRLERLVRSGHIINNENSQPEKKEKQVQTNETEKKTKTNHPPVKKELKDSKQLDALWRDIFEEGKSQKPSFYMLGQGVRLAGIDDNNVILHAEGEIKKEYILQNKEFIQEVIYKLTSKKVRVQCTNDTGNNSAEMEEINEEEIIKNLEEFIGIDKITIIDE